MRERGREGILEECLQVSLLGNHVLKCVRREYNNIEGNSIA